MQTRICDPNVANRPWTQSDSAECQLTMLAVVEGGRCVSDDLDRHWLHRCPRRREDTPATEAGTLAASMDGRAVIERLGLRPHPEGGWFRETWRADAPAGTRAAGTAIQFLLAAGER